MSEMEGVRDPEKRELESLDVFERVRGCAGECVSECERERESVCVCKCVRASVCVRERRKGGRRMLVRQLLIQLLRSKD